MSKRYFVNAKAEWTDGSIAVILEDSDRVLLLQKDCNIIPLTHYLKSEVESLVDQGWWKEATVEQVIDKLIGV